MFITEHFEGRIVHRDNEYIILDIFQKPLTNNLYLGQLICSLKTHRFIYNLPYCTDSYELQKELSNGLNNLMERLREVGLYPPK